MKLAKFALKEWWDEFPVWFFYYNVVMITFSNIAYTPAPRYDFLVTFIFPYSLFLLYYWARIKSDAGIAPEKRKSIFVKFFAATFSLIILAAVIARKIELAPDWAAHLDKFKWSYEITNIAITCVIGLHCFKKRGWKGFLVFFVAAALYGLVLESTGITMGYFFEDNYHLYFPYISAPLVTIFGWSTVFYPSIVFLDRFKEVIPRLRNGGIFVLSVSVAIIAVMFDLQIDPFATEMGLWKWSDLYTPENSLYWFGVPMINFVSWFSAVFTFGVFYHFVIIKRSQWNGLKQAGLLMVLIPVMMVFMSLVEFPLLAITEGIKGPSFKIYEKYIEDGMPLWREPKRE